MRRATPPFDSEAAAAANRDLAAKHPELVGPDGKLKPISPSDPKAASLRKEWIDNYAEHGGQLTTDHPPDRSQQIHKARKEAQVQPATPPVQAQTPCLHQAGGQSAAPGAKSPPPSPPPAVAKAGSSCGDGLVCEILEAKLACSHDGRTPCLTSHLLEVVPSESGDTISLKCSKTACGKPQVWTISGVTQSTKTGSSTDFRAERWFLRATLGLDWVASAIPQVYRVHAKTSCGLQTASYTIQAYPSDKFSVSVNGKEWSDIKSRIDYAIDVVLGAYLKNPQVEFLVGKGEVSAAWEEEPKSHLVFYGWKASVGFDPLIGAKIRIPFGPLAAIPQWLKKYGDAYFFVEFSGGISLTGEWGRTGPKEMSGTVKAAGKITGKIGGSMFLVGDSVITMEVAGASGITFESAPDLDSYDKPALTIEGKWDGIKAEITIIAARGIVEFKHEFNVCDSQTIVEKRPFYMPT